VPERPNGAVLKTADGQPSVGSNPTPAVAQPDRFPLNGAGSRDGLSGGGTSVFVRQSPPFHALTAARLPHRTCPFRPSCRPARGALASCPGRVVSNVGGAPVSGSPPARFAGQSVLPRDVSAGAAGACGFPRDGSSASTSATRRTVRSGITALGAGSSAVGRAQRGPQTEGTTWTRMQSPVRRRTDGNGLPGLTVLAPVSTLWAARFSRSFSPALREAAARTRLDPGSQQPCSCRRWPHRRIREESKCRIGL
jgi:hypothetical protein